MPHRLRGKALPVLHPLEQLYIELESIDLDLILSVQNGVTTTLERSVKKRELSLGRIGDAIEKSCGEGVSEMARQRILVMQDQAVDRNKRIVSMLSGLYAVAKEEWLKVGAGRVRRSPYARRMTSSRRLTA